MIRSSARKLVMAMVVVAMMAVLAPSASAGFTTGTANDGYCEWTYGVGHNNGSTLPRSWASESLNGCELVGADLSWFDSTGTAEYKPCYTDASYQPCIGFSNAGFYPIQATVKGKDWEYGTWQTLNKSHTET